MRQILYVSESLIGEDVGALDALMVRARDNNALDGITGLLWTDGRRFAQVIEGNEAVVGPLLERLRADPRHRRLEIVDDRFVEAREFGEWSMTRPANDPLAELFQDRMLRHLDTLTSALSTAFQDVIRGTRHAIAD